MAGNKNQEGPQQIIQMRIGKALLQYFKPIQVILPQKKEAKPNTDFKVIDLASLRKGKAHETTENAKNQNTTKDKNGAQAVISLQTKEAEANLPTPTNWLELVVNLLSICRRASKNLRQTLAHQSYSRLLKGRGQKIKTLGTIIDTTPMVTSLEEETDSVEKQDVDGEENKGKNIKARA